MSKRILIAASYGPSLLNFRGPLLAALVKRGLDVHVCAPQISAQDFQNLQGMNITVHDSPLQRTGLNPLHDIKYCASLRTLMRQISPDIFVSYTIKPNIWGAIAAAFHGIPSVAIITGLGYMFTDNGDMGLKTRMIKYLSRRLYRSATDRNWRVIFQNPDDRDDFIQCGCLKDANKVRMVNGSGVDLDHFQPAPLPPKPVFLMISRLLGNKGVREYGQAAVAVKRRYPKARFLLVGYIDKSPDAITQSELDSWVNQGLEYLGPMLDVRPAIAQSRVYVLPSYREGTPRSVLEAMAMGRPILTTDAPGCREAVRDGVNGFLVPVQSVAGVEVRMVEMIEKPESSEAMGQASLSFAQEKYDIEKVNATMLQHFGLS